MDNAAVADFGGGIWLRHLWQKNPTINQTPSTAPALMATMLRRASIEGFGAATDPVFEQGPPDGEGLNLDLGGVTIGGVRPLGLIVLVAAYKGFVHCACAVRRAAPRRRVEPAASPPRWTKLPPLPSVPEPPLLLGRAAGPTGPAGSSGGGGRRGAQPRDEVDALRGELPPCATNFTPRSPTWGRPDRLADLQRCHADGHRRPRRGYHRATLRHFRPRRNCGGPGYQPAKLELKTEDHGQPIRNR